MPPVFSSLASTRAVYESLVGRLSSGMIRPNLTTAVTTIRDAHLTMQTDMPLPLLLPSSSSSPVSSSSPWSSSVRPLNVFAFLRRLFGAIGTFLLKRISRIPIIVNGLRKLQTWFDIYPSIYEPFGGGIHETFTSKMLEHTFRFIRILIKLIKDFVQFCTWTLDPIAFVRRLYRFCVGLIVLYCFHALLVSMRDQLCQFLQWWRIEKGIWNGDVKCARKRELDLALGSAQTYEQWKHAAMELDELEHERMIWKRTMPSTEYQFRRIAKNVESLRNLIATHKAQQVQSHTLRMDGVVTPRPDTGTTSGALNTSLAGPATPISSTASTITSANDTNSASSTTSSSGSDTPSLFSSTSKPASDPQALMRFLRSRLNRHIGNITNSRLYYDETNDHLSSSFPDPSDDPRKVSSGTSPLLPCRVGTKILIESYQSEVIRGLETILHDPNIPASTKLSFFRETRHAYGRSALLLNGGSNLGLLHLGVVKALLEIDVLPQIICGSSTGAIFAALICSRTDLELSKIGSNDFLSLEFPSVQGSLRRKLRRFLEEGILMDISALIQCVRGHIGDLTFEQAYQRYGRILNIVVTPIHMAGKKKRSSVGESTSGSSATPGDEDVDESPHSSEPILLNYLTAPSVLIWSAACASCAVPHLYAPVELLAKNPNGEIIPYFGNDNDEHMRFGAGCVDGAVVKMDVATDRLRTLFNCNNFIVSQLNLSLIPFIFGGTSFASASPLQKFLRYLGREVYQRVTNVCCLFGVTTENLHSESASIGRHTIVRIALYMHSLTSQQIFGNITLVPPVSWRDYSQLLENPNTSRLNHCVDVARRYTWTRGSLIQAHCGVEFALDRCVRKVRNEMGMTMVPSISAAFAHPNRNYVGPSQGQQVGSYSPATTPVPTNAFWSRKLNARAMQPSRKASFTGDAPSPAMHNMLTHHQIEALGRASPPATTTHNMRGGITSSNGYVTPSPINASTPLASSHHPHPSGSYHSSPSAAHHRSNSTISSPLVGPPIPPTVSPLSPPIRMVSGLPSSGVEFVGGSVRPPPAIALMGVPTIPRRASIQSQTGSPERNDSHANTNGVSDLIPHGHTSSSSSRSSSVPSSPVPADSSHDDLVGAVGGGSHVSIASPTASSTRTSSASVATTAAQSRASIITPPIAITPTTPPPATNNINDGSLLRTVPSLSGRMTSDFTSPSVSGGVGVGVSILPPVLGGVSSVSSFSPSVSGGSLSNVSVKVRDRDDSFNRGVMAHLHQNMFVMPKKKKKVINKRNTNNDVSPSTTVEAVSKSAPIHPPDTVVTPTAAHASGSDSNQSDADMHTTTLKTTDTTDASTNLIQTNDDPTMTVVSHSTTAGEAKTKEISLQGS